MRYPRWFVLAAFVVGFAFNTGARWALVEASTSQLPTVMSGDQIGFRVEGHKGKTPVGTLVIRVGGEWVEPEFAAGPKPLTVR